MKKIISLILVLILTVTLIPSVFAYDEWETELANKIEDNAKKAKKVNQDGWYYVEEDDVVLYVKLEKEHYVVGDEISYAVQMVNYGDRCIGVSSYHTDALKINEKFYFVNTGGIDIDYPEYAPTYYYSKYTDDGRYSKDGGFKTFYHVITEDEEDIKPYFDGGKILKSGTYTLAIMTEYTYGEFAIIHNKLTDKFVPADDEKHTLALTIDIPVYEREEDIPKKSRVKVKEGPEVTESSYYEKYPIGTVPPVQADEESDFSVFHLMGYIIIALSVAVIITVVIIFVVVNKKKK